MDYLMRLINIYKIEIIAYFIITYLIYSMWQLFSYIKNYILNENKHGKYSVFIFFTSTFLCFVTFLAIIVFVWIIFFPNQTTMVKDSLSNKELVKVVSKNEDMEEVLNEKQLRKNIEALKELVEEYKNCPPDVKKAFKIFLIKDAFMESFTTTAIVTLLLAIITVLFKNSIKGIKDSKNRL